MKKRVSGRNVGSADVDPVSLHHSSQVRYDCGSTKPEVEASETLRQNYRKLPHSLEAEVVNLTILYVISTRACGFYIISFYVTHSISLYKI